MSKCRKVRNANAVRKCRVLSSLETGVGGFATRRAMGKEKQKHQLQSEPGNASLQIHVSPVLPKYPTATLKGPVE